MSDNMTSIVRRIQQRRQALGYSYQDLATITKMSKSTLQRYESGSIKNLPLDKLQVLASALQVTPEYLMGWEDKQFGSSHIKKPPRTFPHDTIEVAEAYTDLPDKGSKNMIRAALRLPELQEDTPEEYVEEEYKPRLIPYANLPASAGDGEFLDGNDYGFIETGPDIPLSATEAIRIRGASMEPKYRDGQIAWIQRTPSLDYGEIGIFILNCEGYIKKRGENELISINPEYPNIEVGEFDELRTYGRVVHVSND